MLRGIDVQDIEELKRQGLSVRAISRLTGYDRKTIRKYLIEPDRVPVYGPRTKQPGKLESFQPYLPGQRSGTWQKMRVNRGQPFVIAVSFPMADHHRPAYPISGVPETPPPGGGGISVFDSQDAIAINRARLAHLDSLDLPLSRKSVLDVGCGVGHLSRFFVERGCRVTCVDGRRENIDALQLRYPGRCERSLTAAIC